MLFILDHDVSAVVGTVIRAAGHQCHTVGSAGLALAADDDVSVFADDHHGILLTHDKELIERRRRNTFGYHVRLGCLEWDAPEIVRMHLAHIADAVSSRDCVCAVLTREGLTIYPNKWI